jgi:hypothetical protein
MDVYETLDKAFAGTRAGLILYAGENIGRWAFKTGKTGNVRAFVQVWGSPMETGSANGYGYDKHGAAMSQALNKLRYFQERDSEQAFAFKTHLATFAVVGDLGWEEIKAAAKLQGFSFPHAL